MAQIPVGANRHGVTGLRPSRDHLHQPLHTGPLSYQPQALHRLPGLSGGHLLATLGLQDDADFATDQWDKAAWSARRARLAALFLSQPRAHWQAQLEPTDACFGAVLSPPEAAEHPHMRARGVYVEQDGTLQAVPAPRFDGAAYAPGDACAPGAHTQQVREQLLHEGALGVWRTR